MSQPPKRGRPRKERYALLMGGLWKNPKIRRLSNEALGVLTRAWSYASSEMTDGRVPLEMLEMWSKPKRWASVRAELTARHPVSDGCRGEPLLHIAEGAIDAECHDFTTINITSAEWEKRLESDRNRKRNSGDIPTGNPSGNVGDIPTGNSTHFQGCALDEDEDEDEIQDRSPELKNTRPALSAAPATPSQPSSPKPQSEAPPKPDPEPRIAELSGRYPAELVAAVHAACSRHRKSGVMAGSVWLATLEKLAAYEAGRVVDAMRIFADRYSTGEWDESYLVGIVRNNRGGPAAKSSGWLAPTTQDEYRASAGATDLFGRPVDLGANVTDEDRARVERIGSRRAHG